MFFFAGPAAADSANPGRPSAQRPAAGQEGRAHRRVLAGHP